MGNIIRLVPDGGSSYTVDYGWKTFRYLLSNGNTIDVRAIDDGSTLRDEVLKIVNKVDKIPVNPKVGSLISIAGSCTLPEPEPEPEETTEKVTPTKRPAKKRVERGVA